MINNHNDNIIIIIIIIMILGCLQAPASPELRRQTNRRAGRPGEVQGLGPNQTT